jgi:hypothetical protein
LYVKNLVNLTNMARRKKLNEDQPDNAENADNADDTFGLPEIEYEPLKRDETSETEATSETSSNPPPERTVYEREEVHNRVRNNLRR